MAVSINDALVPEAECLDFFGGDGPFFMAAVLALLARNALDTEIAHWGIPTGLPRVVVAVLLGSCSSSGEEGVVLLKVRIVHSMRANGWVCSTIFDRHGHIHSKSAQTNICTESNRCAGPPCRGSGLRIVEGS